VNWNGRCFRGFANAGPSFGLRNGCGDMQASANFLLIGLLRPSCDRSIEGDEADRRILIQAAKIRSDQVALRRGAARGALPKIGADFADDWFADGAPATEVRSLVI
jgi:hypothetical protein